MEKREPDFWGVNEPEQYRHEDRDEAIEDYLDAINPEDWPETIAVEGAVPRVLGDNDPNPRLVLESVLESLDDEFGGEDAMEPTDKMMAAAQAFCSVIRREYTPWQCEVIVRERVTVAEWVAAHRPDWLEPEAAHA